ncbi:EAL domain-containing protein [Synechococcus sp. RSCCF101]|uniref:EAL domain-containing protein n=1 Tax=Synechococcus sp. RSCCF101 TaxID=2511069 RepID=UPI001781698A|nr:EAL domain-containing protein [Synechococcus sp. RSCCF101]
MTGPQSGRGEHGERAPSSGELDALFQALPIPLWWLDCSALNQRQQSGVRPVAANPAARALLGCADSSDALAAVQSPEDSSLGGAIGTVLLHLCDGRPPAAVSAVLPAANGRELTVSVGAVALPVQSQPWDRIWLWLAPTSDVTQPLARRTTGTTVLVCRAEVDDYEKLRGLWTSEAVHEVMAATVNRVRAILREEDSVRRVGSHGLTMTIQGLEKEADGISLVERILDTTSQPIQLDDGEARISLSIGAASSDQSIGQPQALLNSATLALGEARLNGGNRMAFYDASWGNARIDRQQLCDAIERGLENGEFTLFYQPQVDLVSREILGLEALIRWQHPEKGLLLPGAFLPVIDDTALAVELGEWVLDEALNQLKAWMRQGLLMKAAVNISSAHLLAGDFPRRLRKRLDQHPEINPADVEIEILESTAFSDFERAQDIILECHRHGVRFSLDDFGTGYCSLAYCRSLPVDQLKVDQSFVRDMLRNPTDMEIVESIAQLADVFGMEVIAEGIEDPEHAVILPSLNCHRGQGYAIGRPMPPGHLREWIEAWTSAPGWGTQMEVFNRFNIQLVIAAHCHLAWIDQLLKALADHDSAQIRSLARTGCPFRTWYAGRGKKRYGHLPGYGVIGEIHRQSERMARQLIDGSGPAGSTTRADVIEVMTGLRAEFVSSLAGLLRSLREDGPYPS